MIVSACDFIKETVAQVKECIKVKKTIKYPKFVDLLKIVIMASFDILIVRYQSDKVSILKVMLDFHALPKRFLMLLVAKIINKDKLTYLIKTCVWRF